MALKRAVGVGLVVVRWSMSLTSESVQSPALPLQGVHDVHGGDSLPLGMFGVGDCVTDHVLQENLEHATGFLVDKTRNTLHTTSASETTDGGLCNTLDVVTKNFAMTLSATLSQAFASFATSRHD